MLAGENIDRIALGEQLAGEWVDLDDPLDLIAEEVDANREFLIGRQQRQGHGDVVLLETGDEVPADGRVLKANDLMIDQSLMTGESEPVRKQARPADDSADGPEQPGCLYRGTQVVDGSSRLSNGKASAPEGVRV